MRRSLSVTVPGTNISANASASASLSGGFSASASLSGGLSASASISLGGGRTLGQSVPSGPDQARLFNTFRFWVEMKSITEGAFTECSGLDSEINVHELQEGGLNDYVHRLPSGVKVGSNLILKRGLVTKELWDWYSDATKGKIKRQNISVILYAYNSETPMRWDFTDALPVKWNGPSFKADAAEVAIETIELIHRGFSRVD